MTEEGEGRDCHQETFEIIPWLITERVTRAVALAAEAHIAQCASCQIELEQQRKIQAAIAVADPIEYAPQASLQTLESRIDELERELPDDAHRAVPLAAYPSRAVPTAFLQGPSWLRPLVLAQAAALVLVTALLAWLVADRLTAPRFQTATAVESFDTSLSKGATVRLVVAPDIDVGEFAALVQNCHGLIVAGPTGQNVWTLRLPEVHDIAALERALARLRADSRVSFAEPVAGSTT